MGGRSVLVVSNVARLTEDSTMAAKKTTAKKTPAKKATTAKKAAPRKRDEDVRRGATALGVVGALGLGIGALIHKAFSA